MKTIHAKSFDQSAQPWQEPDADRFRIGDIWEAPRGKKYTVVERVHVPGKKWQMALLAGEDDFGGKRVLRDWDDIGSFDRGTFWVRPRAGRPEPVLTPSSLRAMAARPGSETSEQALALLCAEWMESNGVEGAAHVGPFSAVEMPSMEEMLGQAVYLKSGASFQSLRPKHPIGTVTRAHNVTVANVRPGSVYRDADGLHCVPPKICWAGTGNHLCYVDANSVIIPDAWKKRHKAEAVLEACSA